VSVSCKCVLPETGTVCQVILIVVRCCRYVAVVI